VITVLENKTYKLLKKFYCKKKLTLQQIGKITGANEEELPSEYISELIKNHFISIWETKEIINDLGDRKWAGYSITLEGSAYVEHQRSEKRNFWVPYLITTAIALLSLITSLADHFETILYWFCA